MGRNRVLVIVLLLFTILLGLTVVGVMLVVGPLDRGHSDTHSVVQARPVPGPDHTPDHTLDPDQDAGAGEEDVTGDEWRFETEAPVKSINTGRVFFVDRVLGFRILTDVTLRSHPNMSKLRSSIRRQLMYVRSKISPHAFALLKNIPIWNSPRYDGYPAGGAYHPGSGWLRLKQRPVEMTNCIETFIIDDIEAEYRRMPLWLWHELAHGYHFRYMSTEKKEAVRAALARTKAMYTDVPAYDGAGQMVVRSSYPAKNEYEFFAEMSENYIGYGDVRNDIYPFRADALRRTDPETYALVDSIWGGGGGVA